MDSLRWEVQRLEVENRRLREQDPEAEERVDCGAELESARVKVAEKTERIKTLEQQLANSTEATTEARRRASEAEERAAELSRRIEEPPAANLREHEATATDGVTRAQWEECEAALQDSRDRVRELESQLALAEESNQAATAERETVWQQTELERYRALEDERRKWETRESRLYTRLEAVEEELRAVKAAAVNAEDNERLREQLRTLTSDLNAVQSLVGSLTAENGRLIRENLSVQERQDELRNPPGREGRRVDVDGGHGTHAHQTITTTARERVVQEQPTGLAEGQSHHEQRWTPPDRGSRTRIRLPTDARSDGRGAQSENLQNNSDSSLRTLPQEPTWDGGEERPRSRDSQWGPTPATRRMASSAPLVGTTPADTLTTLSSSRPCTVTFSGPVSRPTTSGPTGNTTKLVSGGHPDRLEGGPPCMEGSLFQPPEPVSNVSSGHGPSLPNQDDHGAGLVLPRTEHAPQPQLRDSGGVTQRHLREMMYQAHNMHDARPSLDNTRNLPHCAGVNNTQSVSSGTHQRDRACTTGQPGGIWQGQEDRPLHWENPQVTSLLPNHYLSLPPQSASVVVPQTSVNTGVGDDLQGVRSSNPTPPSTSLTQYPIGGTVPHQQVGEPSWTGVTRVVRNPLPSVTEAPAASSSNLVLGAPSPATTTHINSLTQLGTGVLPATMAPHVDAVPPAVTQSVAIRSVPLMGQLPQIPRFTGEGRATGESFSEWHEHFENVAMLAGWNDHWKLVHLTSNLRDTAMAFYRSCGPDVRSQYVLLVAAMRRRFTPIRLTAVQAQLFHNRQQQEKETVDQFAQDLQKLYNLAYAGATSEGPQAERMGRTLLANQFVTGLRPDLKRKIIGTEGSLEELVLKARFEEAKARELVGDKSRANAPNRGPRPIGPSSTSTPPVTTSSPPASSAQDNPPSGARGGTRIKCYNCGLDGHMARNCPYPKKGRREEEARGPPSTYKLPQPGPPQKTMSTLVSDENSAKTQVEHLGKRLQNLEEKFNRESPLLPEPPQKTMSTLVSDEDSTKTQVEHLGKRLQNLEEKFNRESPLLPEPPQKTMSTLVSDEDSTKTQVEHLGKRLQNLEERFNRESPLLPEPPPTTMSATVEEEDDTMTKVEQLSKRLQGLEEKLVQKGQTQVLNSVAADQEPGMEDHLLGPSVTAKVLVNGVATEALIDTGSPATVVSLDFVLDVFVKEKAEHQTPAQWREETSKKFSPPSVSLKAYSGHKLNIISQVCLQLTHGGRTVEAIVLVQEGALHELLVGTDLQSKLGFALVAKDETRLTDLLTGADYTRKDVVHWGAPTGGADQPPWSPGSAGGPAEHQSNCGSTSQTNSGGQTDEEKAPFGLHPEPDVAEGESQELCGVVRLLKTVKVPSGYQKTVRASISGKMTHSLLLFTPHLEQQYGLVLPDGALEGEGGSSTTVIVENHGLEPVHLQPGTVLGTVVPVEEVTPEDCPMGGEVCKSEPDIVADGVVHQIEVAVSEQDEAPAPQQEDCTNERVRTCPAGSERSRRLVEQLALNLDHLSPIQREELLCLITSFSDVFALNASELGTTTLVQHVIRTGEQMPIRQPVRRMPFALRGEVDQMVKEMLEQGVVQPSSSPWASPIVLVRKKDGGMRFCVDYRRLNHVTKLDEFPLPRIDDTLDLLAGAMYFTTLDLASGYWQVAVDPASQEKTAFATSSGLYEFRKMPFGLVNAPATFQRLMEVVLSGLARDSCHVYLDDVLVLGRTLEEHNANLTKVLSRLREAGLRLKPKKCEFAQESVRYLGHVVSAQGVQADPEKLRAVSHYSPPTDVKSLRSFLGLASYYRRFVPGFSRTAAPLHALTRNGIPYIWTPDCQQAFEKLKELLTSAPLLKYPDFTKPFILETDASGDGLGAVLAQRQEDGLVRPIAYASRSLQKHERNYGITELEGLGVVWAAKHFRPYLYGHRCTVFTDHEALKSLLNTPQPSGKLARWGMALQELNLTIEHRSGKHNANADALSRHPLPESIDGTPTERLVAALTTADKREDGSEDGSTLATLQQQDAELAPMIKYLETGTLPQDDREARQIAISSGQYTLEDDILYHVEDNGTLRVVPPVSQRERLFMEAHGGRFGAHLSDAKVYSEIRRHYWWMGMRRDVSRWTKGCIVCATRSVGRAVKSPLTPIPVAGPFDRIGVDVIKFPKTSRGNQYAVVFVDYLTKWPEVFAVPDQSAATIAKLLVEEIVSRHGVPSQVLSDRGRAFLSSLMQEVERLLGFKKVNTSAYHPQTDGLVERYNRTLTAMLAKTVDKKGPEWDTQLPYVLFAYRACQQSSTQESPFFLLYGRDPRLPTPAILSPKGSPICKDLKVYGAELYSRMSEAWELARQHITKAQKRQKGIYDQKTKSPFREGERAFLFKPAERTGTQRKFARPFHGPYRLVEVGTNTARIRPVDKPEDDAILVSLDRLRRCPDEVADEFWPSRSTRKKTRKPCAGRAGPTQQLSDDVGEDTAPSTKELGEQATVGSDRKLSAGQATEGCDLDRHEGGVTAENAMRMVNPPITQTIVNSTRDEDLDSDGVETSSQSTMPSQCTGKDLREVTYRKTGDEVTKVDKDPWTTAKDQNVDSSTQLGGGRSPNKRGRRLVEDRLPNKWAGRLRGSRSPRTATQQQGEV